MPMIMEFFNKVFDFLFLTEDGKYSFTPYITGFFSAMIAKYLYNKYCVKDEKYKWK
ncbi:hypothetical protein IR073_06765 [Gemella sp. 19428wG2_WT2a]|nr:hypothetical protein [Gemella sp. 19428wG2_WT2a]